MTLRTRIALATDRRLLDRIISLSSDTTPEEFLPMDEMIDQETIERQKAESSFQHSLCRRTWWRLTFKERSAIRATVLEEFPHYRSRPVGPLIEAACCLEVQKILEEARSKK